MNFELIKRWAFLLIAAITGTNAFAQKVKCRIRQKRGAFPSMPATHGAEPERPHTAAALCKHCRLDRS